MVTKQHLEPIFFHCPICKAEVFEVDDGSRAKRVVLDEEPVTLLTVIGGKVNGTVQGYRHHHCRETK